MADVGDLRVRLSLDNAQFERSVASMNRTMQAMGQEIRGLQNRGREWGSSIDGLRTKQEAYSRLLEGQQTKVRRLAEEYERAKQQHGEHSQQAEQLAVQLNRASAEMERTQRELNETTAELERQERELAQSQTSWARFGEAASAAGAKLQAVGDKMKDVGKELTMKVTAPLAALGAASVKTAMDFEAQMDRVGAIAGATGAEMEKLSAKAMELGASTSKSASEVAIGMENMAAMGFQVNEIIGAMPGIISAAEASGSDMAQTAEVMASTLNIFGLEASKASKVADILAKTANISAADLTDMQYALKYAGPPAAALGISLEETAAAIGLMTNAGMKGEQAGTTLRGALLGLLDPSEENTKRMEKMGIAITDNAGNFVGLSQLIKNLQEAMEGQTDTQKAATLAALVGKEAVSGMLTLMKAGPETIDSMTKSLENSGGASDEAAAKMKDNLKGALDELGGSLETAAIQIGNVLIPVIRDLAVFVQGLVEKFSALSPVAQTVILVVAGIAAAIGPVILVVGLLVSSIGAIVSAFGAVSLAIAQAGGVMALLSSSLSFLGPMFTALTGPIGLAIAAVVAIGAALVTAYNKVDWFRNGVNDIWNQIKELTSVAFSAVKELITSLISSAVDFGKSLLSSFKAFWDENGKSIVSIVKLYFGQVKSTIEMVMGIIKGIFEIYWPIISGVVKIAWNLIQLTIKNATDIVLGVIQFFLKVFQGDWKGAFNTIKQTAEKIMKNIVSTFKNINLVQIGKDIINGLIKGIGSMANAVWEKVKSIADGIPKTAKKILGIHSPSRVMAEVGKWTGKGLAVGIDGTKSEVQKSIEDLGKSIINIAQGFLGEENKIWSTSKAEIAKIEKRSAEDILKIERAASQKKRSLTADELLKIQRLKEDSAKKIAGIEQKAAKQSADLINKNQKDILENIKLFISDKQSMEEMNLVQEAVIWEKSISLFEEGTKERVEAQKAYRTAVDSINKEIVSINQNYQAQMQKINDDLIKQEQDLNKAYDDAFSNRQSTLMSFAGTFDEFKIELNKSGTELLTNLQSQVDGFKTWQDEFAKLSNKGIDADLLKELSGLGVKALPELIALNQLTDEQLSEYSALYQEKAQLARTQAEKELVGMKEDTDKQILALREAAGEQLDKLQVEWDIKIKNLTRTTANELSSLQKVGVDAGQGLLDGLASMEGPLIAKATQIANAIKSSIQSALDIHSPSRVMKGFGVNIAEGLIQGMNSMIAQVEKSSTGMANAVVKGQTSYDYSRSFAPNVTINTNNSGSREMERTLRRLAFQF